jgi:DNA mismatch repair protein MutS
LLEAQHQSVDPTAGQHSTNGHADRPSGNWQMTLFGVEEHPLLEEIRAADLDGIAPREALELIHSWQRRLMSELAPAKR